MGIPKPPPTLEITKSSGLDVVVKYAVLLSWLVYGAGLTRISGFLRSLGVPTEPSTYALPTVLSYGAYFLLEILESTAIPIIFLQLSQKEAPRKLWRFIGWAMPAGIFASQNYWLWSSTAPISTRVHYALYFLTAAYILVYLCSGHNIRALSVRDQILIAAVLFYLLAEGSGYRGDLDAFDAVNNPPSVQFLLAPDAVAGANKLGVPFSSSELGLTDPLNVVVVSEKMYYVRIQQKLGASAAAAGIRLDWEAVTVAISRDKVLAASNKSAAPE